MKKKVTVLNLSARLSTFSAMRSALCLVGAMLFALSFPAEAQQPKKIPRIGWIDVQRLQATAGLHDRAPRTRLYRGTVHHH